MSKYIIDIPDNVKKIVYFHVGNANAVWTTSNDLDDLELLTADYINEHYGSLQDDAYQRGIEDGKAAHEKGCEGCKYECENKTKVPCILCSNNFKLPCAICSDKLKNQWTANDDKIVVGDEVANKNGDKTIVTYIYGGLFDGLCSDGSTMTNLFLDDNHKTGRHFDVDKILDEMKGNNDK